VLFYNSCWGTYPDPVALGATACAFTRDRRRLPEAAAVIFHLPALEPLDGVPKYPGQRWVAWCLESDHRVPALADPAFMRHFELTMTYRRDATVWAPYFGPATARALLRPPAPKTAGAPVAFVQSSGHDWCGRRAYVAALMRGVKVHAHGRVFRNQPPLPPGPAAKIALISRYKFTLAFENTVTPDYVTEKLYEPLIAGSVPVYRGAPNVADFAPAPRCFIDAADFAGPAELAAYLDHLDRTPVAYAEYLAWKTAGLAPGFLALVEAVREDPLRRLCAVLLRDRAAGVRPDPGGRPARPFPRTWRGTAARAVAAARQAAPAPLKALYRRLRAAAPARPLGRPARPGRPRPG
jgi:hypothetical protein